MLLRFIVALALVAAVACSSDNDKNPPNATGETLGQTIGVNTHYGSYGPVNHESLAQLADAGVSFVRNDLTWDSVEQQAGVYDFVGSGYDALVESCESLGLRILFILDYGNPLYGDLGTVADEEGRQAFAAFAGAAAQRYGGRGHSWEIWNEPNLGAFTPELYAELIRATVPALKAADPNAEVAVGALVFGTLSEITEQLGMGLSGSRFLEELAETGALSLADEVTIHLHRSAPPEDAAGDIDVARDVLQQAGYPLPVSSGEWGYSTYDPDAPPTGINYLQAVTPDRQASYIARMLLSNYSQGVHHSVVFKDVDAQDPEPGNMEHHFGLMTHDATAKPSYDALSTLTELLGDAGLPETIALAPGEHALRFQRPGDTQVIALWAEQSATWLITAQGSPDARVLGRNGDDQTPAGLSNGAQVTLEPDDGPLYLVGDVTVESIGQSF